MASSSQSYGRALPDQVERIATLFDSHLELISDVRDLYRDRVTLEREYAAKLQTLTKKAAEKKARMEASFILADEPTKAWDESALKQKAYDQIIESMSSTADDHLNVADALSSQVVDVLKVVTRTNDETKKKEMQFFQKLVADRDRTYADRLKYDEECGDVDLHRQKQGRAHDDRHAERIARQADQQRKRHAKLQEVRGFLFTYIISTAISNKIKDKFYSQDLPDLEDTLQHAQVLQTNHLDVLKGRLVSVERALSEINVAGDQGLFIDYNIRAFTAPNDWKFEPCATFYDTDELNVDPAPKVFLQNKLTKGRIKLQELTPLNGDQAYMVLLFLRRDVEKFSKLAEAYETEHSLGNIDEISDSYMESRHQLAHFGSSECILEAEIGRYRVCHWRRVFCYFSSSTLLTSIRRCWCPDTHTFKSSSFSIPTTCGYCKASIWGLSKQGKTCKACGLCVHSKCELKVPADCQHGTVSRASSVLSRKSPSSPSTISPRTPQTPTPSSFVHSTHEEDMRYPTARVVFDFAASSEFELTVKDGEVVKVMEPDDGSGWVKVADTRGNETAWCQRVIWSTTKLGAGNVTPTASSFSSQGSGEFVRAIYQYVARGSDEISLADGEMIELSSGPTGGRHYGDGWWEGFNSARQRGIFPSNYVEPA
ncbi:hypothetical protein BDZ89DRAFT_1088904 [Hymenopellis radicata]|nr:hypothetical protein BDZ89DRAFT_1088904 [Hymenopellis radicata]